MSELKTAERLALIRAEARASFPALESATKIDTDTYLMDTSVGVAKVTISAVKDPNFSIEDARTEYEDEMAAKIAKADAKAEAKALKDAEKAAKKAE